jgi:hypothetical protein
MDWEKVASYLEDEFHRLMDTADHMFAHDLETQRTMRQQARIALMLSGALRAGMKETIGL